VSNLTHLNNKETEDGKRANMKYQAGVHSTGCTGRQADTPPSTELATAQVILPYPHLRGWCDVALVQDLLGMGPT